MGRLSYELSYCERLERQRDQLSFNDIRLMNRIYCSNVCSRKLPCQRGGYTDPRRCDRCRCPDGFTGQFCEQVMPGYGAVCGGRIQVNSGWTKINSPGYPREFKEGQECSWLLVAPPGQVVEMQFIGEFEMYCKRRAGGDPGLQHSSVHRTMCTEEDGGRRMWRISGAPPRSSM
ncbi:unnamed protein product [Nippostrongylus brasiliensis]|uniref:CUB domain-containing protein n=1 Tax=Nippostrongylus brasiliensis TaxID=27835 RepID=A0A0N4YSJ5_NIPBR|nr:unnamed protein product [Nippostrongylus brasiliensis]